ncbi:MAG TPA: TonB-dependent receptor [Bacteroidia bacterium]|jgi:outer membrane receptor protein involved in Fe transport|nr:TonB-dependent receptor [Bacteroidia bacterium]
MRKYALLLCIGLFVHNAFAQMGGMMGGGGGSWKSQTNVGHFYGKVLDSVTHNPIPFAAVQLTGQKWDSASQSFKSVVVAGQLTGDNGEFSLEKLSVLGDYTLQISAIGFKIYTKKLSFNMNKLMKQGQKMQSAGANGGDINSAVSLINAVDKDLGNILLSSDATTLKTVTVDGAAPMMEIKLDKRVFDVSKSITTTGGTAEDVLKTIPAVNVDIDGNVTLRNSSPQIYVDGMPSTLTIDQIPADNIDKIEVITNPSAKFDASAGSGGIINIIMKHNQSLGYNGSVRGGIDEFGKLTGGLDLNVRDGKINVFGSVFYKQIKHNMYGTETKDTAGKADGPPYLDISQHDTNTMNGYFAFARGGFDYFIDNRNTLTLTATYGAGNFNSTDLLHTVTDTLHSSSPNTTSSTYEPSVSQRTMQNEGLSVSYKHLFPKEDENVTASLTINQGSSNGTGTFPIMNYNSGDNLLSQINEEQISGGTSGYYVAKVDYVDPVTKKIKIETGAQATINGVNSNSNIYINNNLIQDESNTSLYNQQTYAAYFTYTQDLSSRLSVQGALRVEQSLYSGHVTDSTSTLSLSPQTLLYFFPGAFATFHLNETSDLQFSYTTHITRPNFTQLVVNNYSNPENIQIANPNLKPSYMNSFEFNYINNFSRKNTLLFSVYYKQTDQVITNQLESITYTSDFQQAEYSYENANYSYSEGAEITTQNSLSDWLDVTANFNLFESGINATNLNVPDTAKKFLSYFAKLNLTFKLPKNFSIQLNGSYLSKNKISPSSGGGGGRWGGGGMGGGYGGGITPSATGYILPNYSADIAIKKDFLKNNKASLTFSMRDVFATGVSSTEALITNPVGMPLYYQTTSRTRDQQFFQFTFSYRFGQTDFSIFKKKNLNMDTPPDMGGGDQ